MSQLMEWTSASNMACKRWERGFEPIVPVKVPPRVLFLGEGNFSPSCTFAVLSGQRLTGSCLPLFASLF